jgi:glycosyltransferase involved in cell wall biosynthesis
MKLLHVHDFIAPGNSRYGLDLDRRLVARGHTVHILAGVGERGPGDGDALEGIPCHTYPYGFGKSSYAMYRYSVKQNLERFAALQREHGFDLVLLNQPLCATGVLRAKADVGKAYSFISPWADEWRAAHPDAGFLSRSIHTAARNRLEEKALRACDAILVVSGFMRSRLKALHPSIPDGKLHLVPGAVDLERFQPVGSRRGIPGEGPVLLSVRRLVPRMGLENLIDAMGAVRERFPGAQLVIGGEGPLRDELERRADGKPVRFLGFVPDEELPALYRAADLFVLPTRELEGFGLVAIEAMACGTPVVGTPVGAIPEVLDPEFLLPGTDAGAIARGIVKFLESPRPSGLRERAKKYDWEAVAATAERALLAAVRR